MVRRLEQKKPRSIFVSFSLPTYQAMMMLSMPGFSSTFIPKELFILIVVCVSVFYYYY
jgi:hypothetical protein